MSADWAAAGRWAGRLMPPGPPVDRAEAVALVDRLRTAAGRALPLAERAGRMGAALDAAGRPGPAEVLVVDRPGWARAAAQSFVELAGPALTGPGATTQLAVALGVIGTRVLGQFDPYVRPRLLLVAPNVLEVGRAMRAEADDFALWVCVHEQTHALQFAAAPWLADHLRSEAAALLGALQGPGRELGAAFEQVTRAVRDGGGTPLEGLLDEEQASRLRRVTAVMSLLEGHADVTMDRVPTASIRSKNTLRRRMEARRRSGGFQLVLRRLLGLEAKLAQYRDGAAFVREVRRAAPDALDLVWREPEALPTDVEIADPAAWLRRTRP
ncbi:zinc-dependent metalloprotease [Actinotalea sp. M2MS4P-6]|uniref:zinc-dependent metalloprotease n=1 Tax=Actinotalea sp. M2MS4P-6 TaxID=2983762 RepID=UPI0021E51189|nr:zinc-dependent metalloprotease [Actinotalea sp. M2MS4P-6]MCV2394987.1 zinc-dependent metalloprotease [Actinotalea sp. M2MS4P-6]